MLLLVCYYYVVLVILVSWLCYMLVELYIVGYDRRRLGLSNAPLNGIYDNHGIER